MKRCVEELDELESGIELGNQDSPIALVGNRPTKPSDLRAAGWALEPVELLGIRHPVRHEVVRRGGVEHAKEQFALRGGSLGPPIGPALFAAL